MSLKKIFYKIVKQKIEEEIKNSKKYRKYPYKRKNKYMEEFTYELPELWLRIYVGKDNIMTMSVEKNSRKDKDLKI